MAFYGMDHKTVLKTPAVTFWMLHRNIDRISAERDLRSVRVAVQTQSSDSCKELLDSLAKQVGMIVEMDEIINRQEETLDREGLQSLKGAMKAFG